MPVVQKPASRGVVAWCLFAFLRALMWSGSEWARVVYVDFVQSIGGVIYWYDAKPSRSLQGHEAVHYWQQRRYLLHPIRYLVSVDYRRHAEAMAYAFEVVVHARSPEERAMVAANPVYKMGWTRAEARRLIGIYAALLRGAGW